MWSQAPAKPLEARPPVTRCRPERPSCVPARRSRFPGPGTGRRGACRRSAAPPASGNGTGPPRRWRPPVRLGLPPASAPAAGDAVPAGVPPRFMVLVGVRLAGLCRCVDLGQQRAHRNGGPGLDQDALQPAAGRRGDLDVDLVGGHVAYRLVGLAPSRRAACATRRSSPRRPRPPSGASEPGFRPNPPLRVRVGRVCGGMRAWPLSRRGAHGTPPSCRRAGAGPPAPGAG